MSNERQEAIEFAKKHGIKLKILSVEYRKYFDDDKQERYVFKCKLTRNKKSYTFTFGQSLFSEQTEPDIYDVLSCLEKYGYDSFKDFCSNTGFDSDSISANKIYKNVMKEYRAVEKLFGGIIDKLREIQ
jgi:hypothetical protein